MSSNERWWGVGAGAGAGGGLSHPTEIGRGRVPINPCQRPH